MILETYSRFFIPDAPLRKYSALGLGGSADWLYIERTSTQRLIDILNAAWSEGFPTRIIGGGANVLISDKGIRGLVILSRVAQVQFAPEGVSVTSGHGLTVLARKCASQGLSGLEWAASVPGTVGGAVVNNAGAHGSDTAGSIDAVEVIDAAQGHIRLSLQDLAYGYRASLLKTRADKRFFVTQAHFRLTPADPAAINARMDEYVAYRKATQPPGASLGSIFKNPPNDYAGRLIEACGLKGFTIGGAQVSTKHANFFINRERATASDYRALIEHVQNVVFAQTGIRLETEIEIVGEW